MEEVELSEFECDALLLDDQAWRSKYASELPAAEEADPYEWMDDSLARLLPENVKVNAKVLNDIKAALQTADVQSEAHLMCMSMEDLKRAKVPLTARKHLCKEKQEGYVGQANGRAIDVPHTPGRSVSECQSSTLPWSPMAQISVDSGILGGAKTTTEPTATIDEPLSAQEPVWAPPPAEEGVKNSAIFVTKCTM